MPHPHDLLAELTALGAHPDGARTVAHAVATDLAGPDRHYHSIDHVRAVLDEIDRLLPHEPTAHAAAVRLAAWFHDVVYDPTTGAGVDEAASAARARAELASLGLDATIADEVARLVLLTAGHRVEPTDRSGAVLVDADLAVLASPPADYDRYAAAVRLEYALVPDETWAVGRAAVLTTFLDQLDACFTAGPADDRARRRTATRANLLRERATLTAGDGPAG